MKATITQRGVLVVTADNQLELYALRRWHEQWEKKEAALRVDISVDFSELDTTDKLTEIKEKS